MMKVLIPVDGSDLAESVFPWLKVLAGNEQIQAKLLRAYFPAAPIHVMPELTLPPVEHISGESVESVVRYLQSTADELGLEEVTTESVIGEAADVILTQADDHDLVLMGSHGRGGLGRWLLGSVTTKVVRGCHRPVLVVGSRNRNQEPKLERILVPLDGSSTAEAALESAMRLARAHSATLVLFRGLMTARPELSGPAIFEAKRAEMKEAQEYLAEVKERLYAYTTEVVVAEESPLPGILKAASELHIDLIALGSHGRSGIQRWLLGSVAEAVLQKAPCPVMVVSAHQGED